MRSGGAVWTLDPEKTRISSGTLINSAMVACCYLFLPTVPFYLTLSFFLTDHPTQFCTIAEYPGDLPRTGTNRFAFPHFGMPAISDFGFSLNS